MIAPEEIPDILAAKDRGRAGETAPPQGLRLVKIEYPEWEERTVKPSVARIYGS